MTFLPTEHPHRRFNPLRGEWVMVSPHRTKRPWQGQIEPVAPRRPSYDPTCYLCPGNSRAEGVSNPDYESTFVFANDFAALLDLAVEAAEAESHPLFKSEPVRGACEVICFHPRHDLTLPELERPEIMSVIKTWQESNARLGKKFSWVQIFENKGAVMGCSNPHPHGQIWASNFLPNEPSSDDANQRSYFQKNGTHLLLDYSREEEQRGERIICANSDWLAVTPYWAVWPFEALLMPRRHVLRIDDLNAGEVESLAEIMKSLLTRYDNLFETSFPYSMGWHGAPHLPGDQNHWQLHAHFYPPLLRSGSVKKFMVGYEMLAEAQRDLTPEQAAARLRAVADVHYKTKTGGLAEA